MSLGLSCLRILARPFGCRQAALRPLVRHYINFPKGQRSAIIQKLGEGSLPKHSKNVLDLVPATLDDVMSTIPHGSDSHIIYCLNSRDFPLSLAKRFFRLLKVRQLDLAKVIFAVTLVDNVVPSLKEEEFVKLQKYYVQAIQAYLAGLSVKMSFHIQPDQVVILSDKHYRPILELHRNLALRSCTYYIIGETNSGKSTLAKRLMRIVSREAGVPFSAYYSTSPTPFKTRTNMTYCFEDYDYTVIDTPGYLHVNNGIFGILDRRLRLYLYSQYRFDSAPLEASFKSRTTTEVFSVGDFFFLKPRGVTLFKYRRFMYGTAEVFPEYSEATYALARKNRLIAPRFRRYLIPPFKGKIDLIMDNLGFVELDNCRGNGADYWQVFMPENVKKLIRVPSLSESLATGNYSVKYVPLEEIPMAMNVQEYLKRRVN